MKFCEQLGKYIEQLSCTAKELCKLSGISPSTFSRYRSGERIPEIDTVAFDGLCNCCSPRKIRKMQKSEITRN